MSEKRRPCDGRAITPTEEDDEEAEEVEEVEEEDGDEDEVHYHPDPSVKKPNSAIAKRTRGQDRKTDASKRQKTSPGPGTPSASSSNLASPEIEAASSPDMDMAGRVTQQDRDNDSLVCQGWKARGRTTAFSSGELASSVPKPEPRQHRQSPIRRHRRPQRIRVVAVCILWLLLIFLSPDKLTFLDSGVELSECFVQSFHFRVALAARRANHQTLEDVVQVDTRIIPAVGRCTRADGIHGQNGGVCNYPILMYNLSVGGKHPARAFCLFCLIMLIDFGHQIQASNNCFGVALEGILAKYFSVKCPLKCRTIQKIGGMPKNVRPARTEMRKEILGKL
eukprot:g61286.t1